MINIYGVISRLSELMKYAHPAAGLRSGRKDGQTELLLADSLRAGEGEKYAAGGYLFKCGGVEPAITYHGVADGTAMLGKSRRVEHDEVISPFFHTCEELERIFGV